jgi:Arc/MetJ-type ribon-helix-helix transcriptional regulator
MYRSCDTLASMKTATIPSVRVEPEFRETLEGLLEEGESLSQFVESALRASAARRQAQSEFVRRGLASITQTQLAGNGIPAEAVIDKLEAKLAAARKLKAKPAGSAKPKHGVRR